MDAIVCRLLKTRNKGDFKGGHVTTLPILLMRNSTSKLISQFRRMIHNIGCMLESSRVLPKNNDHPPPTHTHPQKKLI